MKDILQPLVPAILFLSSLARATGLAADGSEPAAAPISEPEAASRQAAERPPPGRPNIVIILADDMGYSDIGCYGGEIRTPVLDSLAAAGLRFTQFYNTARCCPTRASLLTGLYPHQAGVGHMMEDKGRDGYRGDLNQRCRTIAEVLRPAGYATYMAGKWHVTPRTGPDGPKDNWPLRRGFDRFFGTIAGGGSYYDPFSLTRDDKQIPPDSSDFYYTDAIAENAARFVREHGPSRPFFLYVAFTCPHWPMHARPEDVGKYRGVYDAGWDRARAERYSRMVSMGLVDPGWKLSPRDTKAPAWEDANLKEWQIRCMEVYAAMVDRMDQAIGRIVRSLEETGQIENTLLFFLADNGGCAEEMGRGGQARLAHADAAGLDPLRPDELQRDMIPRRTRDGRPVRQGRGVLPGPPDTFVAYGLPWANVSNTPFREYKHWVHEGGISTPLIVHWPRGVDPSLRGKLVRDPAHLIDLMATCVDVASAAYPQSGGDQAILPLEGISLRPAFEGRSLDRKTPLFWEHEGNRAVREGRWKLVAKHGLPWELYDMEADRSELEDLAEEQPDRVRKMAALYDAWAARCGVAPWPVEKSRVEKGPVERAPVEKVPDGKGPVQKSSVQKSSVQKSSVDRSRAEKRLAEKAPVEKGAVEKRPVGKALLEKIPVEKRPVESEPLEKKEATEGQGERTGSVERKTPRPNILWITCEDIGPQLGCYGEDYANTPNLDRLAARGMIYLNAWSTAPVCAPARTAIISGMYPSSTGSEHMRSLARLPSGMKMYPQILRESGYYATNNSKEDYNLEKPGKVWDDSSGKAHWKNRAPGQPFFAIFNHTVTHESQVRSRPHTLVHDPEKVRVPAYHPDTPEVRRDWAQYHDRISEMDSLAGENLREIEQAGLAEDTVVFFYGDHGPGMPRCKRWPYNSGLRVPLIVHFPEKYRHLAPSEYRPGARSARLVAFVDLAPTLLNIAGIRKPEYMQGHAFLGDLEAPPQPYLFGLRGRMDERYDMVRSVRDERFVYTRNYLPHLVYGQHVSYMFETPTTQVWKRLYDEGKLAPPQTCFWERKPPEELYDLEKDPDEVENLAAAPEHQETLRRLRGALRDHLLSSRDVGFLPEGEIHERSTGSTPFEMGHDEGKYPLARILDAAERASSLGAGALPDLEKALSDGDGAVRYWGALGILMRGKAAVDASAEDLRKALGDPSPYVRIVAAEALGRFGDGSDLGGALGVLLELASAERSGVYVALAALNAVDALDEKAAGIAEAIRALPTDAPPGRRAADERSKYGLPRLKERILEELAGANPKGRP